jgi:hypothetical protein
MCVFVCHLCIFLTDVNVRDYMQQELIFQGQFKKIDTWTKTKKKKNNINLHGRIEYLTLKKIECTIFNMNIFLLNSLSYYLYPCL